MMAWAEAIDCSSHSPGTKWPWLLSSSGSEVYGDGMLWLEGEVVLHRHVGISLMAPILSNPSGTVQFHDLRWLGLIPFILIYAIRPFVIGAPQEVVSGSQLF